MDIKRLISLLDDADFRSELRLYRKAYQRFKVRFRNNAFTGQLKQLANMTKSLQRSYSVDLLKSYNNKLAAIEGNENKKKRQHTIKVYLKFLHQMIGSIEKLIDKTLNIYAQTAPRLRVGHLAHHFIVVRTSIARIRICMKALLIYTCDLYSDIHEKFNYKGMKLPTQESIKEILVNNKCKPRAVKDNLPQVRDEIMRTNNEHIGQLIDRATMKPKK